MYHSKANEKYNQAEDIGDFIPADEPVFVLRAQDIHAAETVRFWADKVRASNPELAEKVFQHSLEMDRWPIKKEPDV